MPLIKAPDKLPPLKLVLAQLAFQLERNVFIGVRFRFENLIVSKSEMHFKSCTGLTNSYPENFTKSIKYPPSPLHHVFPINAHSMKRNDSR